MISAMIASSTRQADGLANSGVSNRAPYPSAKNQTKDAATALCATLGHYTMTRAIQATPITVIQPFSFLQLVWATLLGLYAFGEEPDFWTWVGAGVIVGSATYIAHRESVRHGRAEPKLGPH